MECPGWFLHLWLGGMKAHVKHLQWRRHESQRTEYKPSLVAIPSLLRVLVAQNFYSHARSSVLRRGSPETPASFMLRHGGSWVTQTGGQPYQTLNTERKDGKVGPSGRSAAR